MIKLKKEQAMTRRKFLSGSAAAGLITAGALQTPGNAAPGSRVNGAGVQAKLTPPANGRIPVAVAITAGATIIDFCGPWEVFQDVMIGGSSHENHQMPFQLFTVSDGTDPIQASAGMKIVPDYRFDNAPTPKVVVVPAQMGSTGLHAWLRKVTPTADLVMSVCTGAFQLGRAGLLSGLTATTHHDFLDRFEKAFTDVKVKRGLRFVENGKICTAGGLTSGIDLALRVVVRYYGREVAERTAVYMEYQSKGWVVS
jgi:transcriptional regulator GlxA family with amidase domain